MPCRLGDPVSVTLFPEGLRRCGVLNPCPQHRLIHDARINPLEMLVPPAQAFLKKADTWPRLGKMRIFMGPGADQPLFRAGKMVKRAKNGIRIAVGPAADHIDRHLYVGIILAHRTVGIKGVTPLMTEPVHHPQPVLLQSFDPHLAPALANNGRIWRRVGDRKGGRAPMQLVGQKAAAHEMDIVGIAIIRRAERHHRSERGRTSGRHLKAVEATP